MLLLFQLKIISLLRTTCQGLETRDKWNSETL